MSRAGLAAERTALAWRRTAVASMITGALFLNHAVTSGWRPALIAPIGAAIAMAALAGLSYLRNRSLHEGRHGRGRWIVATATAVIAAVAVLAVGMEFTDPVP